MKKLIGLVLLIGFFGLSLGGCTCPRKEVKSEPPPPAVEKPTPPPPAPEPVKPVPPKKDRN